MQRKLPDRLYEGYVFDLDGTVYLGEALLPGAKRTIETLRRAGRRIAYVSNKPVATRQSYADKLTRLGLPTAVEDVVNSSQVLVRWLREHAPGARVFPIAEQVLIDELAEAGMTITDRPGEIEYVIASFDRTFVYRKLQIAFDAIRAGARLIASNADAYCPVPGGGEPDAASIIAAIQACTGCRNELVAGKPSALMARTALAVLGTDPGQSIMVGDRVETDILMGHRAGMWTAMPLTGATSLDKLAQSEVQPDYVLERLDELLPQEHRLRLGGRG
ncbi:MAG: HAD-IIA family hydrolase [Anaerolineae bacterium]|nr:HAD-IIA family hydrolase [Anaerolineae bacterium]